MARLKAEKQPPQSAAETPNSVSTAALPGMREDPGLTDPGPEGRRRG